MNGKVKSNYTKKYMEINEMNTQNEYKTRMILKALSDLTRFKILTFLKNGEKCVCEIVPISGVTQSAVSQHLKILREAGLLENRREGASIYYKIVDERIIKILDLIEEIIEE